MKTDVLIIGSGHAGGMSAIQLRSMNYDGSITVIGEEKFLPYQRPPLSKSFLTKGLNEKRIYLKQKDYYKKNNIKLKLSTLVVSIDKNNKYVELNNREKIHYSKLIIATGSVINNLQNSEINQNESDRLIYLRNIDDAIKLRTLMGQRKSIGIIGAGYIGLETAASAASMNMKTYVIEYEDRVMKRTVSELLSKFMLSKHKKNAVNFYLKESAKKINKNSTAHSIVLSNSINLEVDIVVAGIGIKPNISLASNAGLIVDDGIVVDEHCLSSDKNIFAVGDCSNHFNRYYQRRLRLESVQNAVDQAKTVASYITKKPNPYIKVPWFWSEQYNIKIQIAGVIDGYDDYKINGSTELEKFSIAFYKNKNLIAIEAINSPKEFMRNKKLLEV